MNTKIEKLTLEQKARLLCGASTMGTFAVPELGIRSLCFSDGPNGLRKEDRTEDNLTGVASSLPATVFPSGVVLASSWDQGLLREVGKAIAEECHHYDVDCLLGPAFNIKRNPKCGRNFEYYSEDPLLSGYLAASFVEGVQSQGVAACPKHFCANNLETFRFTGDSIVDERALHEIYLRPFEMVTKLARPWAIMSSYNQVNGTHMSENGALMNGLLREKWGFDGLSMTDWGGIVTRVGGLQGGTDLEMPGMVDHSVFSLMKAVQSGEIPESVLDQSVDRLLTLGERTGNHEGACDFAAHYELAKKAAVSGAILLKNEGGILPLSKEQKVVIIGGLFKEMRYQGSGSALLNPERLSYHKEALEAYGANYSYAKGYVGGEKDVNPALEEEAMALCQSADTILFYGGQNDYVESEGFDRDYVTLQENQIHLLERLIAEKKRIVLVLFGGSSVELPFLDGLQAVLYMGLPGEAIGEATTSLLYGEVCPSGRLAETWRHAYSDTPFGDEFLSSPNEVYKESIFVGYRYDVTKGMRDMFPFGYGLSYTSFSYSHFEAKRVKGGVRIVLMVKNVGPVSGAGVVQIYVAKKDSALPRPMRELKGFAKVELKPGEEKPVEILIPEEDLKVYDVLSGDFVLEGGAYAFEMGRDATEILFAESVDLDGVSLPEASEEIRSYYGNHLERLASLSNEDFARMFHLEIPIQVPGKRPYTMETRIGEYRSFMGRIFASAVSGVGKRQYKKACKLPDGPKKEREKKTGNFVYRLMPNNSLRSLCYSSSGGLPYKVALAMEQFINGHFLKGLIILSKKEKDL